MVSSSKFWKILTETYACKTQKKDAFHIQKKAQWTISQQSNQIRPNHGSMFAMIDCEKVGFNLQK